MSIPRLATSIFASLLLASLTALVPPAEDAAKSMSHQRDGLAAEARHSAVDARIAQLEVRTPNRLQVGRTDARVDGIVPSVGRVFPETGQ